MLLLFVSFLLYLFLPKSRVFSVVFSSGEPAFAPCLRLQESDGRPDHGCVDLRLVSATDMTEDPPGASGSTVDVWALRRGASGDRG